MNHQWRFTDCYRPNEDCQKVVHWGFKFSSSSNSNNSLSLQFSTLNLQTVSSSLITMYFFLIQKLKIFIKLMIWVFYLYSMSTTPTGSHCFTHHCRVSNSANWIPSLANESHKVLVRLVSLWLAKFETSSLTVDSIESVHRLQHAWCVLHVFFQKISRFCLEFNNLIIGIRMFRMIRI